MIEKLYIKNYLIIKEAEINFGKGLNILTGETGAGKSIILDALSLILGERADYSIIKKDQDKLVIEGHFNLGKNKTLKDILSDILPDEEINTEAVIIRRELLKRGTSRNFINDTPVNISDMKALGDMIIDIHSQNEHQSLLNKETHREILDDYCGNEKLFEDYRKEYSSLRDKIRSYIELSDKKEELISKRTFLDHELKEINNVNLQPGEDEEMETELRKLENVERISNGIETALKILYEDDVNSMSGINTALKELRRSAEFDDELKKTVEDLENSYILVKESAEFLNSYRDSLNFNAGRTEEIRVRLSAIGHLKKKYGLTLDGLIERGESLQKELIFAENFDYELEKLLQEIENKKQEVLKIADEIFILRTNKAKELNKKINAVLKEVGLENSEFRVNIKNTAGSDSHYDVKKGKESFYLGPDGYSDVEFIIKTNKGGEFAPLQKSASGGEISRIMLAIKAVIADKDKVGILVFDEIDAGISGRIASKVGKILRSLSETHQVICITHLPQIAAISDTHFHVSKKDEKGETIAAIRTLNKDEKINEIAKLISGEEVTPASTKSAKELISA